MAFSWAPMTMLRWASCSVLVPVPRPTLMVMSLRAFQSRGSTVTHWLRSRAVCGCEPCLRTTACSSENRSRMPVSAKMRAIIFIFACAALNIWLAMVATWFCRTLGSTPWPCRDTPVRHSRVASWYCSSGKTWPPTSGCWMTLRPPGSFVRTIPPGRDTSRSSSVVSVAWLSGTSVRGIVGQIGVVEQRAQKRGLDALDIHHQVGDRAAEEPVRHDDRRHRRERDIVHLDDIGLAAALEHLAFAARGHAIESAALPLPS